MRRTPLKKSKSTLKRSPLKRGTKKLTSKTSLRGKIGKKTLEWNEVREELKKKFAAAKITTCELKLEGCLKNWALGMAHSLKRKDIKTPEELREVVLACVSCHEKIEYGPKEEMYQIIKTTIESRKVDV